MAGAPGRRGRIAASFAAAADQRRGAFIPYLPAGFPTPVEFDRLAAALCDEGVDVLEIGVPFSDPLADGPVIQRATQLSLEAGTTAVRCLEHVGKLRARHATPIVLMTYLNPIARYGVERFTRDAAAAGVDGVILVDLPPEEDGATWDAFDGAGIDTITMVAPTTDDARLRGIAARARGFLYVVSRLGVTGVGGGDQGTLALLDRCRAASDLPRSLGFGITPDTDLAPYRGHAEGFVCGSALLAPLLASHDRDGAAGADERERSVRATCRRFRERLAPDEKPAPGARLA